MLPVNLRSRSLACFFYLVISGALGNSAPIHAQITPDTTLPSNSLVNQAGNNFTITGGTQIGGNLFHSFQQFSVPTGGEAFFNNGATVQNIINRVTGGLPSTIDGILRANGTANLFLINPQGILFGPNARLNIGGSFVATTANTLEFGNQGFYSATNPNSPSPLLTVNPSALLYNQITRGDITSRSTELLVPAGRSLLLAGGNVSVAGGFIEAPDGRLELTGSLAPGAIALIPDGDRFHFDVPRSVTRGDVSVTNGAIVGVSGTGSLNIYARDFRLSGNSIVFGGIYSSTGTPGVQAGAITIDATNTANLAEGARIFSVVASFLQGNAGDVVIRGRQIVIADDARVFSSSSGVGNSGNVQISALEDVWVSNSTISASIEGQGKAGNVQIQAGGNITLDGGGSNRLGSIQTAVGFDAAGLGGNIIIQANSLSIQNSFQVIATTFGQGDAGNVSVQVKDTVSLTGNSGLSSVVGDNLAVGKGGTVHVQARSLLLDNSLLNVSTRGVGDGGNIEVNVTDNLTLINGGSISATTTGRGNSGSISVDAGGQITIDGQNPFRSGIFALVSRSGIGNGGNIAVRAGSLAMTNEAGINTSTFGQGNAGQIQVQVKDVFSLNSGGFIESAVGPGAIGQGGSISIQGRSLQFSDAVLSTNTFNVGNAGNINLAAIAGIALTNGAQIQATTSGQGNAGNITVRTGGLLSLDGYDADGFISSISSSVRPGAIGQGGNVAIQAGSIALTNGAGLLASTRGQGNAGNIVIQANDTIAITGISPTGDYSQIFTGVLFGGNGNAGTIDLAARDMRLSNQGLIGSDTAGNGNAGNIQVDVSNQLSLTEGAVIQASTRGQGNAGNIAIRAGSLISLDGYDASGSTSTISSSVQPGAIGQGGNISVQAQALSLTNGGGLVSSTRGQGDAGTISVQVNDTISIVGISPDGIYSQIFTGAFQNANGKAGDINLVARKIRLDDQGTIASDAETGDGGNIRLRASDYVLMQRGSFITTSAGTAQTGGNGGNIFIDTLFLVSPPRQNNDIVANAFSGKGGNITINAQGIFGFTPRSREDLVRIFGTNPSQLVVFFLPTNDIAAISRENSALNGVVTLNAPNVDPSRGLATFPTGFADRSNQITQRCSRSNRRSENSFYITGNGGLPPKPGDPPLPSFPTGDVQTVAAQENTTPTHPPIHPSTPSSSPPPIIEAQRWIRTSNGDIYLVAGDVGRMPIVGIQESPCLEER